MAIGVSETYFMWRTKTTEVLDIFPENLATPGLEEPSLPSRRRGIPSSFTDAQLCNRRDQLVQAFGAFWGRLGRELPRMKHPEDISQIFEPLRELYVSEIISVYSRPSSQPPSSTRLRKFRNELRKITEPWLDADRAKTQAFEQLRIADAAFDKSNRGPVKRARKARRKEAFKAQVRYRTLDKVRAQLELKIRDLESGFARHELFRFLKSKRYEITPESLANATAGLPYMGWRQSMRRCKKSRSIAANGGSIQIFKAIRYLVGIAQDKHEKPLVLHFRKHIPSLPTRYKFPKDELAEKWLYLERAIRKVCRSKPHPKHLHFEITERYLRNSEHSRHRTELLKYKIG